MYGDCGGGSDSAAGSPSGDISAIESYFGGLEGEIDPSKITTKKDVIKALQLHAKTLISIRLSQPATPISQALKDFRRERVLFNEVPFIPDKTDSHRNVAFAMTLKEYILRLRRSFTGCDNSCVSTSSSGAPSRKQSFSVSNSGTASSTDDDAKISKSAAAVEGPATPKYNEHGEELLDLEGMTSQNLILQRACRTSAGSDSFFMVQSLFATVQGTFVTQRTNILGFVPFVNGEPPVQVDVFVQEREEKEEKEEKDVTEGPAPSSTDAKAAEDAEGSLSTVFSGLEGSAGTGTSPDEHEHGAAAETEPLSVAHADADADAAASTGCIGTSPDENTVTMDLIARIKVCNSFAVYDEDIIDLIAGEPETDPPPWLELETVITDHMNFRTGEQHRVLEVQVFTPETGKYYPPLEVRSA